MWAWVLIAIYAACATFFFIGFASHRSSVGVIGPYTPGYFAFLLFLAALLLLPLGGMIAIGRHFGFARTMRLVGGAGVLLLMVYGVAEVVYASTRLHAFDPFLQFPGARFDAVSRSPDDGVTRVITIGGSTTHNGFLPPEDRYPSVLEELLNEQGRSYEVLNAGMDWWTTKHSHINYVTYLRDWNPDVVVVMHAINDLYRSFAPPRFSVGSYDTQWSHFYGPAVQGAKPGSLLGANLNRWAVGELNQRWYGSWRYQEEELELSDYQSLPDFEVSLRSLVQTLKGDGVRVILLTQPSLYKEEMSFEEAARLWFPSTFCVTPRGPWTREVPSPGSMSRAIDAYNGTTTRIALEEGVELVGLADRIPKTLEYFGDDVHYTPQGAARVAEEVARAVENRPLPAGSEGSATEPRMD